MATSDKLESRPGSVMEQLPYQLFNKGPLGHGSYHPQPLLCRCLAKHKAGKFIAV